MSLRHAALETRPADVEVEVAFWALLGFERVAPPEGLVDRAVWLQRDASQIHLLLADEPVVPPRGHVAVVATDHAEALGRLRAADRPVEERARHWARRGPSRARPAGTASRSWPGRRRPSTSWRCPTRR